MVRKLTEKLEGKTKSGKPYFGLKFDAELIGMDLYPEHVEWVNKDVYGKVKVGDKIRLMK